MQQVSERLWASHLEDAERLGAEEGTGRGTWFFDGNTPESTYRAALKGIEDGDPAVLDCFPWLDLSGEWAGGLTTTDVLRQIVDDPGSLEAEEQTELVDAYQQAFDDAVMFQIEKEAREHLAG